MNTNYGMLKQITKLGILLMMGMSMSADAGLFGFGGTGWKEEVLLHDGSKIIVERTVKRHGRHEIGQRPPIGDQRVSFTMPGTNQRVIWKDEYSEDVSGANFNLMMLDIVQGTAYLLATPAGCLSYNKWGRPNPPYVIFKFQGSEWQRIPLQELPAEIKLPNLLHSSPDDVAERSAKGGVVPATVIREENDGYRQPEYKTILRETLPAARIKEMCEVMYPDGKGGWLGAGWFDQPTQESCLQFCARKGITAEFCKCNISKKGGINHDDNF